MFIKRSKKKNPSGNISTSVFLVDGYRDPETGYTKHKYLSNLTHLPDNIVLAIEEAVKGKSGVKMETLETLETLEVLCSKQAGSISVFSKLYDKYFAKHIDKRYNNSLEAIVINKIFDPKRKNSLKNWIKEVDLGYEISNKNDLYDSIEYLCNNQEDIEKKLGRNLKKDNNSMLLYDVTSTYFEGKGAENICKYGYSRDHSGDRKQVNIGVITSSDGTPISVEVITGNISDKETLQSQIDKIKERYGVKELTFVFDRGMKSKVNLEYIESNGYKYITALSHSELRLLCKKEGRVQRLLFAKEELSEIELEGKYYSLVHNKYKAEEDKYTRETLIKKTEEKIEKIVLLKREYTSMELQDKVSKVINIYQCEKYIDYKIEESVDKKKAIISYSRKEEKIKEREEYDGFYAVQSTNKEKQGSASVNEYKSLQLVERAFNSVKNHINIRPVYHYKEERIRGHIFSCFMSYYLLHKFKGEVTELLKEHTLDSLLTELKLIQKTYFKVRNYCFSKISKLTDIQADILKKVGVSLLSGG